ncbi:MAG: agmatinase [Bacteroidetes bacterium GWA2_30_7]|nr:MAG: agmatinase [Bacteroidetes bacterium GWA2_30_7]
MDKSFNPNDIGIANGNYFGLPYSLKEADIIILPVPWDVTTSYGKGTSNGPQAILDASLQVDLFDTEIENVWKIKVGTIAISEKIIELNNNLNHLSVKIIHHLEKGKDTYDESFITMLEKVNKGSNELNDWVYSESKKVLNSGKIISIIGGDHSVPFGLIKALGEKYKNFGILHIDAHADLRFQYEGFEYSHASIMNNVLSQVNSISKLVQVGVRDFCSDENELIKQESKINFFSDNLINNRLFAGETWGTISNEIISSLPDLVYISFDIDGLLPDLCPNTGTPVPGGLSYNQVTYLLNKLTEHKKKIIGFDLCEVSPGENEWDANVGARILFKLLVMTAKSVHM